jgi:general secretion pathway protein H
MNRLDSSDGFSLLEMLVALAVISLAAGVAYDSAPWRKPRETLNTLSQKISHSAAVTSLHAISTGETASLQVDITRRVVSGGQSGVVIVPEPFKLSMLTGAGLITQDKIGQIDFYSNGTSSGGEIVLEGNSGKSSSIRIYWLTGAISVKGSAGQ